MLAQLQKRPQLLVLGLTMVAGAACAFLCGAAAHAADARSTLYGDVTDPAGHPIENARIFLVQNSTHAKLQTWTNERGNFVFPELVPDTYTLQAIETGFSPVQIPSISLSGSENRGIAIRFEIPGLEETTIVHAGEFEEASVITTHIGHQFAELLPLSSRSLQPLLLLTPGIVMTANNEFSFNGQSTNMNYFTVDGTSVNLAVKDGSDSADLGQDAAYSALGTSANLVSLDSLEEFTVRGSTISPMIGRQSGGHVQLTSRAGSDSYHAEAFELFRNSALDAQDWFDTTETAVNTNLHQNDFGGVFSGRVPSKVRWIGRNYFFLSEESLRLLQPTSLDTYVPSSNMRESAHPALRPFLNVFPVSSRPDPGTGTSRYRLGISNPSSEDNYAIRVDSRRNFPVEGFARYSHSGSSRTSTDTGWAITRAERRSQFLTVVLLWKLRSNIANDLRFNFSENTGAVTNSLHKLNGATIPQNKVFLQGINPRFKMPSLNYSFLGAEYASRSLGRQPISQTNVTDSVFLQHGDHTFGFGFDFLGLAGGTVPSDFNLTVNFWSQHSIISGIADSLITQSQDAVTVAHRIVSLYAQDSWKAGARLTLDYGLRWELSPPPGAKDGQHLYTVTSSKDLQHMRLAPAGTELYRTVYTSLGPRAGFSFELNNRPRGETVVHGGFGLFYSLGNSHSMASASNFPHVRQDTLYNRKYPPTGMLPAPTSKSLLPPYSGQTFFAYVDEYAPPTVYQFSAGLEQHLGEGRNLSVAYIGSESRRLPIVENLTDPNRNFIHGTTISEVRGIGTASYNSLQAQFGQRITDRAYVLASYTWAHSIDDVSDDINGFARKTLAPVIGERSNSDFDLRHSLAAGLTYEARPAHTESVLKTMYEGWSFGGIVMARGSLPLDVTFLRPVGTLLQPSRPDLAPNARLTTKNRHQPGGSMLDYKAFLLPSTARQGNLERNALRGQGAWQIDLSIQRDFHLKDQCALRVRSEFFNALNHPNFGAPDINLGTYADNSLERNTNFGRITRMLYTQLGGLQQAYQIGGPRSVQVSLKLMF